MMFNIDKLLTASVNEGDLHSLPDPVEENRDYFCSM